MIEAEKLAALGWLVAGVAHEVNSPVGVSLTIASIPEASGAAFAAETARGEIKRSSLSDFVTTTREASSQLVANVNRASELVQWFKQVTADQHRSNLRTFDIGGVTEQIIMSLRAIAIVELHAAPRMVDRDAGRNLFLHDEPLLFFRFLRWAIRLRQCAEVQAQNARTYRAIVRSISPSRRPHML